ncbi:MAG: bifunctional GrpB family protein/GNAT family N-acetyltransferase [Myxococcota bacterium]
MSAKGFVHKTIEVVPYDVAWPTIFEQESAFIKRVLGCHCIAIHHIGSTSVPGLSAKRDIDIVCVVDQLCVSLALKESGYVFKGEFNIPLRCFFSKNTPQSKVNLHVVEPDHGFIDLNICFRDYLRNHEDARLTYQNLKQNLLKDPASHQKINSRFTGYNHGKNAFIKKSLLQSGFGGLCVNFCEHPQEWETYHRIREEQIFNPIGVVYDRNHPTLTRDGHYHFVLYRGTVIVTVAHVEFLNHGEAALRSLATDGDYQRKGYGSYMVQFLEKWVVSQDRCVIRLHSAVDAEAFYKKLGYIDMPFHDVALIPEVVDLGKRL